MPASRREEPEGTGLGQWIDGRSSTILPKYLRDIYQASLADPDRRALDSEPPCT